MFEYDEAYYLAHNPDVAEAVRRGDWPSGQTHFYADGKRKGRRAAPEVDAAWYLSAYPLALSEIAAGLAGSAGEHYHRTGKYRGYLPSREGLRADNPAATRSRFGGLWTDAGNATDVVAGRLDLGEITGAQAALLRTWISDGCVVLPGAVPEPVLAAAQAELERAYRGELPDLKFAVHGLSQTTEWVPDVLTRPAQALDLHWTSAPTRDLIFCPAILDFLHLIFQRRVLASQTLGFWRGSAQDGHQDSAYVNYSLPMQFAASWIALEDVREGAGELFYHTGSHAMPEFLYAGQFKGAGEAQRVRGTHDLSKDYPRHSELIRRQAEGADLPTHRFLAKRGDVLIWSADLAHGDAPISLEHTRKSMVTHYCPADAVPLYFEMQPGRTLRQHESQSYYASSQYG